MTWDENVVEPVRARQYVDLDSIDDGRCKASSWRPSAPAPLRTTYENLFGSGGYNRCIGREGHANPLHKDEFGWVFTVEDGRVRIVRSEEPS